MSVLLIFTSVSSVLVGVAPITQHPSSYSSPRIDSGMITNLAQALVHLFSLYLLLLPFLRDQEVHSRGFWICLSIGTSVGIQIVLCIVLAFSWHASASLVFRGTSASMIVALLVVQGLAEGNTAKDSITTNGDVWNSSAFVRKSSNLRIRIHVLQNLLWCQVSKAPLVYHIYIIITTATIVTAANSHIEDISKRSALPFKASLLV